MTKTACKQKLFTGVLLTVSEDESMTIMVGSMAAGRQSDSLYHANKLKGREGKRLALIGL